MKNLKKMMVFVSLVMTSIVFAQPGTNVGSGSGQPLEVITIPISYLGTGSGAVGVQMDINFDNTNLTADLTNCGATLGGATVTCTDNTTFIRLIGLDLTLTEVPSGSLGSIDFTIGGAAMVPSTLALTLSGELYGNNVGGNIPAVGSSDGAIMVVAGPQPDYSSAPVAGTTLALNGSIGTNPTASVDITNVGPVGAPALTGTCLLSGADAASFSITTAAAINVAQGAAAQTMTVDCNSAMATGATLNALLSCAHNGDGTTTPTPANYPLTCDILAITPQYDSTPAGGGPAIALGSVLLGGANLTGSITINNDNGDATTTLMGTCTAPAPFSVTAGAAFSVLQGAAAVTVAFDCDATAMPGMYAQDLTCTHNGSNVASPVTYPMTCEVVAPVSTGTPAGGSSSNATIVAPPGGSTTNTVITFSETTNQGLNITDLNCNIPAGDFAVVTAMPTMIPAGGSISVDVSFTVPAAPGPYADTMTCTYTDSAGAATVTVNLTGSVQAIMVSTMSTMGYAIMMLGLLLVGFFGFRRYA